MAGFPPFRLAFLFSGQIGIRSAENFQHCTSIYGTLVTSVIAMIIAVPVSFGIALFITEMAPTWLRRPVSTAIELLAAIPSIIYGMWGLFVFAPLFAEYAQPWITAHLGNWPLIGGLFQGPPIGIGVFTAGLILAIMVIPFVTAVMRDVFDVVPTVLKESAYGVGCTTWEVMWNVVLPYTRVGVVGGIMLGLGRALGETMAVTFVIGNSHDISMHCSCRATPSPRRWPMSSPKRWANLYIIPHRPGVDPVSGHLRGAGLRQAPAAAYGSA